MLASNDHNRNLRMPRVRELSGAMQRGEWELNGETIKLADNGTLLDGQHRLEAVVHSGVAIQSLVVRGLPMDAQDTIDTGRRRRLADVLSMEGNKDAHALAAALNVLHRYRTRQRIDHARGTAPTPQQALDLLETCPQLRDSVVVARRVTRAIGGPIGVFAALHHECAAVDRPAATSFFDRLEDSVKLSRSDPVLHLRNYVVRPRKDRHFAHHPYTIAALTILAFNFRRQGCGVVKLAFDPQEGFPVLEDAHNVA